MFVLCAGVHRYIFVLVVVCKTLCACDVYMHKTVPQRGTVKNCDQGCYCDLNCNRLLELCECCKVNH